MSFTVKKTGPNGTLAGVKIPAGTTSLILNNIGLRSFIGCPTGITEIAAQSNNLTDFVGLPSTIRRLDISRNKYTDLAGCSSSVEELRCSSNKITSLSGLANLTKLRSIGCSYTHIKTLEGCPKSVVKIVAAFTYLETLEGSPNKLDLLYVSYGRIKNTNHCPVARILDLSCNLLEDISGLPEGIEELCISNNPNLANTPKSMPSTIRIFRCSGCTGLNCEIFTLFSDQLALIECSKNPSHDLNNPLMQALVKKGIEIA